jgi:pimeloyl-ACP methyl ester carboxylesterase
MVTFILRKIGKAMWILLSSFLAISLLSLVVLLAMSPGQPQPFLDENGAVRTDSISEKIRVEINGVEQGMFIQGKEIHNPVLLFVHGGPGMPEYWLTQRYPTNLEDHFTVVWWEQRGAGLSYDPDISPETMTAEQFVADTLAVTRYLLNRFGQKKIYLMAHSWGSYIGIQAAARAPELFYAYIGMGQISYQLQSERVAYEYALERYRALGDLRMVRKLEAAPPTMTVPLPPAYEALRDVYMHDLGIGTTHAMKSVVSGIFLPSWQFRQYTLAEKVNLWRGKVYSRSAEFGLWETMLATDLTQQVTQLSVPVYFFHGRFDYTCAYPLAQAYFDQLQAPIKGFYTFEESAHTPLFEENERVIKILLEDVRNQKTTLADPR